MDLSKEEDATLTSDNVSYEVKQLKYELNCYQLDDTEKREILKRSVWSFVTTNKDIKDSKIILVVRGKATVQVLFKPKLTYQDINWTNT